MLGSERHESFLECECCEMDMTRERDYRACSEIVKTDGESWKEEKKTVIIGELTTRELVGLSHYNIKVKGKFMFYSKVTGI